MPRPFDVVVIGAGAGGLFLARELRARALRCAVVDARPIASGASTRNQGWLQSGVYYAGHGQTNAASECRDGYALIRKSFPTAVSNTPAFFLFGEESDAAAFERSSRLQFEIETRKLTRRDLHEIGTTFPFGLAVPDAPFDTKSVLSHVHGELCHQGVSVISTSQVERVTLARGRENQWSVAFDGEHLMAPVLVLAAGPLIPHLLASMGSTFHKSFVVQKIEVFSFLGESSAIPLLAAPREWMAPNIVPFSTNGQNGLTICLTKADVDIATWGDKVVRQEMREDLELQMKRWHPKIWGRIGNLAPHVYCCQKLKLKGQDNRSHIVVEHELEDDASLHGLISYYPGKFTAAPIAAQACADAVSRAFFRAMSDGHVADQEFLNHPSNV